MLNAYYDNGTKAILRLETTDEDGEQQQRLSPVDYLQSHPHHNLQAQAQHPNVH